MIVISIKRVAAFTVGTMVAVAGLFVGAPGSVAAEGDQERAVEWHAEGLAIGCPVVDASIDPETGDQHFEFDGISTLITGDFVGYDYSRGHAVRDADTGDVQAYFYDTFHGTFTPDGSRGTLTTEGPTTVDGTTLTIVHDQRITGGTGDWTNARGDRYFTGSAGACIGGKFTGEGTFIRPAASTH